jgi:hypothetical protein
VLVGLSANCGLRSRHAGVRAVQKPWMLEARLVYTLRLYRQVGDMSIGKAWWYLFAGW